MFFVVGFRECHKVFAGEFFSCHFFVGFNFKAFFYGRGDFFQGVEDVAFEPAFAVYLRDGDYIIVVFAVCLGFLKQHRGALQLAEQLSRRALDGFNHASVIIGVFADFEEPMACQQVVGFVEADFSCAEFSEAEVEPGVFGSVFEELDFYVFQVNLHL